MPETLTTLFVMLHAPEAQVRESTLMAIAALGRHGDPLSHSKWRSLTNYMTDTILTEIAKSQILETIITLLTDTDRSVQSLASKTLAVLVKNGNPFCAPHLVVPTSHREYST